MQAKDPAINTHDKMADLMKQHGFTAQIKQWLDGERRMTVTNRGGSVQGTGATTSVKLTLKCWTRWGKHCPSDQIALWVIDANGKEQELRVARTGGDNPYYYERIIKLPEPRFTP